MGNIGMIEPVRREGMQVRGDFGLNVFNSGSADYYAAMGLSSLTASFELTLPQLRDLSKPVPTEFSLWSASADDHGKLSDPWPGGHLHLRQHQDESGGPDRKPIPGAAGWGYLPKPSSSTAKSSILDKLQNLSGLGLWALRLSFTTENAQQVNAVALEYLQGGSF